MKNLFFAFTILFAKLSFADCASSGIYVYPEGESINQNSMILIEGYYFSQDLITDLDSKYPVKLVSGGHSVELEVIETYESMMHLTVAILKPKELLKMDAVYTLVIEDLDETEGDMPKRWSTSSGEYVDVQWKVTSGVDNEAPEYSGTPKHIKNNYIPFGCGPGISALFEIETSEKVPLFAFVNLKEKKTGFTNTYLVCVYKEGLIEVGHSMCSGAFTFRSGIDYEVQFRLVDNSGNMADNWTAWVSFDNPVDIHEDDY